MPGYLGYVAAVLVAYVLLGLLLGKGLGRIMSALSLNMLLGYGSLAVANLVLPLAGWAIPINSVTLLAAGWLGLPGTVLSAALQLV